jgi:MFS family permease
MTEFDIARSLDSSVVRIALGLIAAGLLYVLIKEVRKIPAKLFVLMATAFVDMVGVLMVIPLLPFYVKQLGSGGVTVLGFHAGIGLISGVVVSAFTVAQLMSAPGWGRFSDRFGRRPALLIALSASAIAYLIFGFANSLFLLFLSRVVQGAGGGTVGVIQAYVADSVEPRQRARALGWLSAATNLGVALGPVLGTVAVRLGDADLWPGAGTLRVGSAAPGIAAALICVANIAFAAKYLPESKKAYGYPSSQRARSARQAVWRVISHAGEPASRLIWIYSIAIGAFQGITAVLALFLNARFDVNEKTIGFFFMYIGAISVFTRVLLLGRAVDRMGEPRLSRVGITLLALGVGTMPLAGSLPVLAVSVAMIPLGTAFTFPCVTALLSHVISPSEQGLYMGLQQTFGGAARIAAPLFYGWAFDALGIRVPFFFSAIFVFATIFLGLGLDRFARPRAVSAARAGATPAPAVTELKPIE